MTVVGKAVGGLEEGCLCFGVSGRSVSISVIGRRRVGGERVGF